MSTSLPPGSPLLVPWRALRLAGRWLPWLVLWFSAGQLARFGLPWLSAEIGRGSHPELRRVAVVALFVLFLLATATTYVGMLYVLRRREDDAAEPEKFLDLLGRALLPFVIVYVGWGQLPHDAAVFTFADVERSLGTASDPGLTSVIPDAKVAWGLAVGCFLVRAAFERYHIAQRAKEKSGRVSGLTAAFFETAWTLLAISSLSVAVARGSAWFADRRVWVGASSMINNLLDAVPWLGTVAGVIGNWLSLAGTGLVLPLVWLTIAAIVYGVEVLDQREVLEGTRLGTAAEKAGGNLHGAVRGPLGFLAADLRDKYVPLAYGIRLAWRAGIPLFAMFALCYALPQVIADQAFLGVTSLIGQRDLALWHQLVVVVNFGHDFIGDALRVAVLAATYALIQERVSVRNEEPSPAQMASSRS